MLNCEAKYHFKHFHSFGCPVYIFNDRLQYRKPQPKWLPRFRVGVYLVKSSECSSNVSYVLKLNTGYISPQYYIINGDDFATANTTKDADEIKLG